MVGLWTQSGLNVGRMMDLDRLLGLIPHDCLPQLFDLISRVLLSILLMLCIIPRDLLHTQIGIVIHELMIDVINVNTRTYLEHTITHSQMNAHKPLESTETLDDP
ncbi:hypothetical protein G6F68_020105 [Rhizopus microsporus]|nr:hypothetical protein G6F68_020105 [Rhizopus microsporus]